MSPAIDKDLRNLRRRLERWELEHLRTHAADLAERLEQAERRADIAEDHAAMGWRMVELMQDAQRERGDAPGPTRIGLTMAGELVAVPA